MQSDISYQIEEYLAVLAQRHLTTRFVRLSHLDAEMDAAGVPAILAYRHAELFANLVSVVDLFPSSASASAAMEEDDDDVTGGGAAGGAFDGVQILEDILKA